MNPTMRFGSLALLVLCLSCKDEVTVVVPVASVEVGGAGSVLAGSTVQFNATALDDRGNRLTNRSFSWSTSDGSIATVTSSGLVSGVLGGQVQIIAMAEGRSGDAPLQVNNPVPSVASTEPDLPIAGGGAFQLTVRGTGFVQTSEVLWNESGRPTTYVNDTELNASISAADIAEYGVASINVFNPGPGGGVSGDHPLTVGFPHPIVDALERVSASMGEEGFTLEVFGGDFTEGSVVLWNGEGRATVFLAETLLRATIPSSDLERPGIYEVRVETPPPGGGTSEPLEFAVQIPATGPFAVASIGHTCALAFSGQAYCWGENEDGQLGDGSRTDRLTPVPVSGGIEFVSLAATYVHTCGLDRVGKAFCWGPAGWGRLGNQGGDQQEPGPVQPEIPFISIGAGWDHSCAVAYDGQAYCWGRNEEGQLGHTAGPEEWVPAPVDQPGLRFKSVASNRYHNCAVTDDGSAYCWGDNASGQLGDGTTQNRDAPVRVQIPGTVIGTGVGYHHSCAWTDDGRGYCWGAGESGELGNGDFQESLTPVQVDGPGSWIKLSAGNGFTCGILDTGDAFCWGWNWRGRLGHESPDNWHTATPEPVQGLPGTFEISTGGAHACALSQAGNAYCWGGKDTGQLGAGDAYFRLSPVPVQAPPSPFTWISLGRWFGCGRVESGDAYCWGRGGEGSLGNGEWDDLDAPGRVNLPEPIIRGTAGRYHACGVTAAGKAYCWGRNDSFQLGTGYDSFEPNPVPVFGGHSFATLRAGGVHTCGITQEGETLCWGWNGYGAVGQGEFGGALAVPTPVSVPEGVTFTSLNGGYDHTCALSTAGDVWCWGRNHYGQIGSGNIDNSALPSLVQGLPPITRITAGGWHTCALDAVGAAFCWGRGAYGRLGSGGEELELSPQPVVGGHTFRTLTATAGRTCGVTTDDRPLCWGYNRYGALGLGQETEWGVLEPEEVVGGLTFRSFAEGFSDRVGCGVTTSGAGYCWGTQPVGELGIGDPGYEPLPVAVLGGISFRPPEGVGARR
jgi:alpha-tubulin suppressor-like RCC1 family protein